MSIESEGVKALDSQVSALDSSPEPTQPNPWLREAVSGAVEILLGTGVGLGLVALVRWLQ